MSVAIFPEGHRSADGRVAHFKRGAFQVALDAGVPLVPVMISGPVQSIRGYFIEPAIVPIRLKFLAPIAVEEFSRNSLDEIALRVEEAIRGAHRAAVPSLYSQES